MPVCCWVCECIEVCEGVGEASSRRRLLAEEGFEPQKVEDVEIECSESVESVSGSKRSGRGIKPTTVN